MTQEETLDYNKRCAEFLEYTNPIIDKDFYFVEHDKYNEKSCIPKLLELNFEKRFHSDWNWIMEVLKAITKTGYNWELIDFNGSVKEEKFMKCSIFNLKIDEFYNKFMYESNDEKEAVVQAINQFLIWYNKQTL